MELNTSKIYEKLNDYAVDKLYEIIEKLGYQLKDEYLETFNVLIANNKVISVHIKNEEVMKHFEGDSIPPASGPRSWKDGLVHIYPFIFDIEDTETVIEKYMNEGIITHELFHHIITLDTLNETQEYDQYYSYLNEGFVQYLTEELEGREFTSSNYRRNVEFVKELLKRLDNNIKGIMNKRLSDDEVDIINEMYEDYMIEREFMNSLNDYLKIVSTKTSIPFDKLKNYYGTKSIKAIKEDIYNQLLKIDDDDLKKEFDKIVELYDNRQNKKAY